MRSLAAGPAGRTLATFLIGVLLSAGCGPGFLPAVPGLVDYQRRGFVTVPGGVYSVAGVNLVVERVDVRVDTPVWSQHMGAVYSSATGEWTWSHETSFDGVTFVDPSGAVHDVGALPAGSTIPGTHWVVVGPDAVRTKGGRTYHFDTDGRLDFLAWANTTHPRIDYAWEAGVLRIRQCPSSAVPESLCPPILTVHLGPDGPVRVVDERSAAAGTAREALYDYDAEGRLRTARTPFEVENGLPGTAYEYAPLFSLLTARVTSEGERIEYAWEAGRRLSRVTQIGEEYPEHRFAYHVGSAGPARYEVVHTNPVGGETRYRMDSARRVHEILLASTGEVKTFGWPQGGLRPEHITDFDGATRRFLAWQDDDPILVEEPSGNLLQIAYAPDAIDVDRPYARPVQTVVDSLGPVMVRAFDARGRVTSLTDGTGATRTWEYSEAVLERALLPWGGEVTYEAYGIHGGWVRARSSALPELPLRRLVDPVGNVRVPVAGLQQGGVLERRFDAGRAVASIRVAETDALGSVMAEDEVAISRRSDGAVTEVTKPFQGRHEMEYDALGRVIRTCERVDGECRDTTMEYDAMGRVTRVERPNGMREDLGYDPYGRLVSRHLYRDGVLEAHRTTAWDGGHPVWSHDSVRNQVAYYEYDGAGRLVAVTWTAYGERLELDYDLRSRVVEERYVLGAAQRVLRREYDLADRETRFTTESLQGGEQLLLERIHEDGRLTRTIYGNGLVREVLYDAETQRLAGYVTRRPNGSRIETTAVEMRIESAPRRLEVMTRTRTPLASTKEEYWLNPGGSLQDVDGLVGQRVFRWRGFRNGVPEAERAFAWDALSNPASTAEETFVYNAERNRMLSASGTFGTHTYTWDAAGFATSRDGLPIAWTAGGRLARLGPAMSPVLEITWDASDRPAVVDVLGERREFALFGGRVEYDAGTGTVGWLHVGEVSLPFEGDARRYRHRDRNLNVSFVTDAAGAVVSHRRYAPFGVDAVWGEDTFTDGNLAGFVGGTELPGTGLVLLGVRVLDSDVGRFLSPDPEWNPLNLYTYAFGNPVFFWDPDGRNAQAKFDAAVSDLNAANADVDLANLGVAVAAAFAVGAVASGAGKVAVAAGLVVAGAPVAAAVPFVLGAAVAVTGLAGLAFAVKTLQAAVAARARAENEVAEQFKQLILKPESSASVLKPEILAFMAIPGTGLLGGGVAGGCMATPTAVVRSGVEPSISWLLLVLAGVTIGWALRIEHYCRSEDAV